MRKPLLLSVLLLVAISVPAQKPAPQKASAPPAAAEKLLPGAPGAAMKTIDPERIRAHVKFLADDLLEGRGTGQRGGDIAALYIATQFELDGLKPAGDNGTFLQKVPMVGIATDPQSTVSLVPQAGLPLDLRLKDDVVAMDETQNASDDVDAPLVFVGYGIEAPEYKWNDYKDADVRGKVLLMLVNEPPSDDPGFFKGKALTYYGRWTYKFEEAARKGAVGAILIHKTDMASYGWEVVRNSWAGERSYLRADGLPKLKLAAWTQLEIATKVAADSGQNLANLMDQAKSRDFKPVELPLRVKAHMVNKVRPFDSENVLAMLPGSDPRLKDQAVLYSAHWDHLGIKPEQPGDNIYNGAIDNATGCGVLLEIARAYARSAVRPKRSIIFAAVTAEEQGLRGSEYLGKHPPMPAADISLALNFDGIAPYGVPEELEATGAERTTFYSEVQAAAKGFNFTIAPDSNPSAGFYYRSDHFSLARVGIPAFSVNEGMKYAGHPREWGEQKEKEYNQKHYHQPSDQYDSTWDFAGDAKMARFGFALGWQAANQPKEVQWQPGDEFEAARKASQAKAGGGK
jgi:Zn-dependent M28 family amino/carboxypeptidase